MTEALIGMSMQHAYERKEESFEASRQDRSWGLGTRLGRGKRHGIVYCCFWLIVLWPLGSACRLPSLLPALFHS